MDPIYPRYANADPVFYDDPRRRPRDEARRYLVDADSDWSAWRRLDDGHWSYWHPPGVVLADQGWKMHVSAVPENAAEMLDTVSRYCHNRALAFKHLTHSDVLWAANGKDGDRSASGKFITIYPSDESELHDALVDLDGLVGGMAGPYVLSDLRWNAGPVSVRYGAFAREFADIDGLRVAAVRAPDGDLVEDVRSAEFIVPQWVSVPPFIRAQQASLGTEPPPGFPRVTSALHHSNAGGVYVATDADGDTVVLKEARPHAGLTPDRRDAVARVRDEARVLARIDSPRVVRSRGLLEVHGHVFLVMDQVEGMPLHKAVVMRHPLLRAESTWSERREYRDWALAVCEEVEEALSDVHDAGFTHGDLHPGNVIVGEDDRVVLLDLEMARPIGDTIPAVIGVPGFVPRDARSGARLDRYALACIRLFVFAPVTTLIPLDAAKVADLITWVRERFDLDTVWGECIISDLDLAQPVVAVSARAETVLGETWASERSSMDDAIDAIADQLISDADFERDDRVWPGDPAQFGEPGFGLAHGAAGVIVALHDAGAAVPAPAWQWLDRAVDQHLRNEEPRLGLMDGLSGLAWAQRRVGNDEDADRIVGRLRGAELDALGFELSGGLAGMGLVLLDESRRDADVLPCVLRMADRVDALFDRRAPRRRAAVGTGRGGLLRGGSGVALFASRLFALTHDEKHLALAERAVEDDLTASVWGTDGSLQIDEGWRTMPYLGSGSAGLGLVLIELISTSANGDRYSDALDGIRRAASAEFIAQPGLFEGRAGLIHFLVALRRADLNTPDTDAALTRHVDLLRLHAIRRANGLGFPGRALLRLSCDLATGAAGVLSALTAYRDSLAPVSRSRSSRFRSSTPPFALVASDRIHT